MRFLTMLSILLLPIAVHAQQAKEVEVINLPTVQDVRVVEQPPPTLSGSPIQIIGVTAELFTGDLGGRFSPATSPTRSSIEPAT